MPKIKNKNMKIIQIVNGSNEVKFDFYRNGKMYYNVNVDGKVFQFPIKLFTKDGKKIEETEDTIETTFMPTMKAITYMRWIRKAIENGEFIETDGSIRRRRALSATSQT
jgi:hypothetical protein